MDEKIIKAFSTKIRLKRIEMGHTQEYMASLLKISQSVYSLNEKNISLIDNNCHITTSCLYH